MRVAVLSGGRSGEHEVSLASGRSVRDGLLRAGHEPLDVQLARDGRWSCDGAPVVLEPAGGLLGADVAFPVLHGPYGEDGTVQGLLELLDVPYVGAGVMASAVSMDKVAFKDLLSAHGLPQVAYASVRAGEPARLDGLEPPVFVKPARMGSSVGISRADTAAEVEAALRAALEHDTVAIVEAASPGLEVECSVLGNREPEASRPGEIVLVGSASGWYDYEAKYTPGGMELVVPARLPEAVLERVRELAVEAFRIVGCAGMARVDFFVEGDEVLVNELNTIPGFTETSVYARLFEADGIAYPELLNRLIGLALEA